MSIGKIGSSGYNYSYNYGSVNQFKLQQSLSNKYNSSTSSKKVTGVNEDLKDSISFVKDYNSTMSDLLSDANKLRSANSTSVLNEKTVNTSNSNIVSAQKKYNLGTSLDSYEVNVEQLAASQVNVTAETVSRDLATESAEFSIVTNTGNASFEVSAMKEDGTQKTNKEQYQDIAKQINNTKDLGVTASVIEKDGKSSIKLTSSNTGEKNAFLVSGSFAESSGISETKTAAQDAKYSVSTNKGEKREYTSSSNTVDIGYGKIEATLKKTGSADISIGMDKDKITSAVSNLVNSYNDSLKLLNNNADRGTGVTKQLSTLLRGPASEKSMELIGITVKKDGTLSLDKDKLTESLTKDPKLTKDIIGGSVGIAQGAFQGARNGMTVSSNSLINNDLNRIEEERLNDPIEFMSMYSRRGSTNFMNYASVGLMMNMLV